MLISSGMYKRALPVVLVAGLAGCVPGEFDQPPVDQSQTWVQWRVEEGGNGHWYRVVSTDIAIPWTSARAAASQAGPSSHLVTITSPEENNFVYYAVGRDPSAWRGGFGPWIGGFQDSRAGEPSGGWLWVTGEPWVYANWYPGEPNDGNGFEDYAHFFACPGNCGSMSAATWNDSPNQAQVFGFIVESPVRPPGF